MVRSFAKDIVIEGEPEVRWHWSGVISRRKACDICGCRLGRRAEVSGEYWDKSKVEREALYFLLHYINAPWYLRPPPIPTKELTVIDLRRIKRQRPRQYKKIIFYNTDESGNDVDKSKVVVLLT